MIKSCVICGGPFEGNAAIACSYKCRSENTRNKDKEYRLANREKQLEQKREWNEANREQRKAYYAANRDHILECSREYHQANREYKLEYSRAYYVKFRETLIEKSKKYRVANREKILTRARDHYWANRERLVEYQRARREANLELYRERMRGYQAKRRFAYQVVKELLPIIERSHRHLSQDQRDTTCYRIMKQLSEVNNGANQ